MRRFLTWFGGCWARVPGERRLRCLGAYRHLGMHVAYNKRTGARIEW